MIFFQGSFSGVALKVLGVAYELCRIILWKSPTLSAMLEKNWKQDIDENDKVVLEINLEHDSNITKRSFETALKHIDGYKKEFHDQIFGLLAAANYLCLHDLLKECVKTIVAFICLRNLGEVVTFFNMFDYGQCSKEILRAGRLY